MVMDDEGCSILCSSFLASVSARIVFDRIVARYSATFLARHHVQAKFVRSALMRPVPCDPEIQEGAQESTQRGTGMAYPAGGVGLQYVRRFLRLWMAELESESSSSGPAWSELGIEDSFLEALITVCQAGSSAGALSSNQMGDVEHRFQVFFPHADIQDEQNKVIVRSSAMFSDVGFRLWNAGRFIFEAIFPFPKQPCGNRVRETGELRRALRGKRVLEIGAGLGINAVALRALGVESILLTDCDAAVVQNLRYNSALNCPEMIQQGSLSCMLLDVETMSHASLQKAAHEHDVILGADITYTPALAAALVGAFAAILQRPEQVGFLAATRRSEEVWSVLSTSFMACRDELQVNDITSSVQQFSSNCFDYLDEQRTREVIHLFELRRRQKPRP